MKTSSRADELSKLVSLRERGVLTDQEFEDQKRQVLGATRRGPVYKRFISLGGLTVAVVIAVVIATNVLSPSAPAKVTISTVALSESQVQTAINFAMKQVGYPTYDGLCLELVTKAYAAAGVDIGSATDPITYWSANPEGYTEHSAPYGPYGSPPAGAILFWGNTQWSSTGHAAISLGNGSVVSSAAYPYADGPDNGEVFQLSSRNPNTYHYLGYIVPGTMQATNPPATQVTVPGVTTTTLAPSVTVSGQNPQPAGTTQLQPAAGATALQGGGTVSPPKSSSSTGSSPATSPATPPVTSPPATSPPVTTPPPTSPPPTSPPPPPPPTYSETTGSVAHTWTDYANAGGTEGPSIPSNDTVQIACKVTGFAVADGNTWWYQIASSPWNDTYYVSADAFYNNGETSGSLVGTPFVDPSVPNC